MTLSHCNQPLKLIDKDKGEHLCEKCGTTFHIRETAPEKKPNVDIQELAGRVGCFIGIILWLASCNWFLSILENIKW